MKSYSVKEQEKLRAFVSKIDEETNYVILRKFENLPEKTEGGDVDLLVEDIEKAEKIADSLKFNRRETPFHKKALNLGFKALNNPLKAIKIILNDPKFLYKRFFVRKRDTYNSHTDMVEEKYYYEDLMLHLVNHVHHKSTMDSSRIRLDPFVEEMFFEHSVENDEDFKVLNGPEKLFHLLCRGVFDYEGNFSDYYLSECYKIWEEIDEEEMHRLEKLLSRTFFDASEAVISSLEQRDLENLRANLKSYSDY